MEPRILEGVSRRDFIRLGAATALGAAGCRKAAEPPGTGRTSEVPAPVPPAPPKPRLAVQLGVQSYSFRKFKFLEAVRMTSDLGLPHIEPFPGHFRMNSPPERLAEVQKALAASNVTMNAYGVCGMGTDEGRNRAVFDFCKKLDISAISANPKPNSLDLLDKLVEEYDVRIAIHNHGPRATWRTADQMLQAIQDHHPHIGVCLDTGHLMRAGDDPVAAVGKLGQRLHGFHLKDVNEQNHDVVMGTGRLDFLALFRAMAEVGFQGFVSLEYEIHADDPVPGLTQSVAHCRSVLQQVSPS
ncbi:MAG: sugar phosphate isomerase/epimerase family protein [Candidatus Brocadiia bacterium]